MKLKINTSSSVGTAMSLLIAVFIVVFVAKADSEIGYQCEYSENSGSINCGSNNSGEGPQCAGACKWITRTFACYHAIGYSCDPTICTGTTFTPLAYCMPLDDYHCYCE